MPGTSWNYRWETTEGEIRFLRSFLWMARHQLVRVAPFLCSLTLCWLQWMLSFPKFKGLHFRASQIHNHEQTIESSAMNFTRIELHANWRQPNALYLCGAINGKQSNCDESVELKKPLGAVTNKFKLQSRKCERIDKNLFSSRLLRYLRLFIYAVASSSISSPLHHHISLSH